MVNDSTPASPVHRAKSQPVLANQFEFLILADRAEVINGKLYMMGGGWDHIWLSEFPHPYPLSLAVGLQMIRSLAKSEFTLTFDLDGPDGADIHPKLLAFSRVSTPDDPDDFPVVLTVPTLITFAAPGEYRLTTTLDGQVAKTVRFVVSQALTSAR